MSIFGKIMSKLGIGDAKAKEKKADIAPGSMADQAAKKSATESISQVDVMAKLEAMAASNSQKLNWKTSIVDLMKLLGLDSSYAARKELAKELDCPAEKMESSAAMNIWLHKTVLTKLAENGGNVPADLL